MSIYDKASLVLIPSGTKTSKVYSQKPVNGDGDFTFSRSTAATRVNADGNIEKETQNLLKQSNSFNTTWTTSNTSVTSGQSGYDGTNNAWLLDVTGGTNSQRLEQDITASNVVTLSIYVKAGTLNWIRLRFTSVTSPNAYFDLENGVIGSNSGIDAQIESVGNGWYKCSLVTNDVTRVRIYPATDDGDITQSSGNIYIQDAQLEQGLVARDYIETTTAAVEGGITDNVPRLDYTDSSCPALLLEPQRTNLVTQSEYFSVWSNLSANPVDVVSNYAVSPEGVQNASKLTFNGTNSWKGIGVAAATEDYTGSVWLKVEDGGADFTITLTMYATGGGITESKDILVTSEWQRFDRQFTTYEKGASATYFVIRSNVSSRSVLAYGAQLEAGSYATSYIPTYGTSVTRNADESLVTGVADVIGQTEGTAYVDFMFNNKGDAGVDSSFFAMKNSAGTSYLNIFRLNTTLAFRFFDNGSNQFFHTETPANQTRLKIAFAYKQNDFALYINGVQEAVDTNGSVGDMSQIHLAGFSVGDNITENYQTMLFKTRLSNEELAALTTI